MPGKKGNKGGDFQFNLGEEGKPAISKEMQAAMMPVLQQRLDEMEGQDSGYLQSLPFSVQQRIKALKKLQTQHETFEEQFQKEVEELQKKYDALKAPLYSRRAEIVTGTSEPTTEELAGGEEIVKKEDSKEDAAIKGVPEFWLVALKHHQLLGQLVQPIDDPALKHLVDFRVVTPDTTKPDFTLEFEFSENEFFEDKVITKTYTFDEDDENPKDITSSGIKWKTGKNFTVKKVQQKQKQGKGRRGRGGRPQGGPPKFVEEPVNSFFHFFDDLNQMEDIEDEDKEQMFSEELEYAELLREVYEDAVLWFSGEKSIEGLEDYEGMDDDEDDDDLDDDEDEAPAPRRAAAKKASAAPIKSGDGDDESSDDGEYDPKADPSAGEAKPECKQQ